MIQCWRAISTRYNKRCLPTDLVKIWKLALKSDNYSIEKRTVTHSVAQIENYDLLTKISAFKIQSKIKCATFDIYKHLIIRGKYF